MLTNIGSVRIKGYSLYNSNRENIKSMSKVISILKFKIKPYVDAAPGSPLAPFCPCSPFGPRSPRAPFRPRISRVIEIEIPGTPGFP